MSYSAQTEKLRLPQWVQGSKDHPDFLTDVNQAFEKIDGFAQGIDNTVDGLPEQVEEVATILQSVQEDVGEHTEELARQGVRIGILETGMAEVNGLDSRVAALEDGQMAQDEEIDALTAFNRDAAIIKDMLFTDVNSFTIQGFTSDTKTIGLTGYRYGAVISAYPSISDIKTIWGSINVGDRVVFKNANSSAVRSALNLANEYGVVQSSPAFIFGEDGDIIGLSDFFAIGDGSFVIAIRKTGTSDANDILIGTSNVVIVGRKTDAESRP